MLVYRMVARWDVGLASWWATPDSALGSEETPSTWRERGTVRCRPRGRVKAQKKPPPVVDDDALALRRLAVRVKSQPTS